MSLPPHERARLASVVLDAVDPRLAADLRRELEARLDRAETPALEPRGRVVLVGHRAAGKSRILPHVARLLERPSADLDRVLEAEGGPLRAWLEKDPDGFRAAERRAFAARPDGEVLAVGGGFLSLHGELLAGHTAVLVPVAFETYRERLLVDGERPRLRPDLDLEREIEEVYRAREAVHATRPTVPLVALLAYALRRAS